MTVGQENIRSIVAQKEKELHEINEYRIRALEEEVARKVSDIALLASVASNGSIIAPTRTKTFSSKSKSILGFGRIFNTT